MTDNPFPAGKRDPLLVIARIFSVFLMVIMGIAIGALLIAIPTVLFKHGEVVAELVKQNPGLDGQAALMAIVGIMALAIVPCALVFVFLRLMNQLIDTVGAGDPFAAENAGRLSRMGWLVLAIQAVAVPLGALGIWLSQHVKDVDADVNLDISGSGFVLALVLFILARVFRHGAAMREELEGTV